MKKYRTEILKFIPSLNWLVFFVLIPSTLILTFAFRTTDPQGSITTTTVIVFILILGSYVVADLVGGTDGQIIDNKIAQGNFADRNLPSASTMAAAELVRTCTAHLSKKD
jgi:ABC-type spermidine/putrescine transport system permease subunit I